MASMYGQSIDTIDSPIPAGSHQYPERLLRIIVSTAATRDLDQVRIAKDALELAISALIRNFEARTSLKVVRVVDKQGEETTHWVPEVRLG